MNSMEEKSKKALEQIRFLMIGVAGVEIVIISLVSLWYVYGKGDAPYLLLFVGILTISFLGVFQIVLFVKRAAKLKELLWREIAQKFGYQYTHNFSIEKSALMFREGSAGTVGHGMSGKLDNHNFRIFEYSYITGTGKNSRSHFYTVFETTFLGSFPHLYLNNIHNKNLSGIKQFFLPNISLPTEFEKMFKLYVPKEYEIEVFEIFTPDILSHLLNNSWEHDLELVNQKLFIFSEKSITGAKKLEQEIENLKGFLKQLAPKLDRMSLAPIGDLTHNL